MTNPRTSDGKTPDRFGRVWPKGTEICEACGQPDNCGDCNHQPYTDEEVKQLTGEVYDEPNEPYPGAWV